jgi:hypothetical protein
MSEETRGGVILPNQRTKIQWTSYLACAYAEGFGEGECATDEEQLEAWSYLIKTGQCWTLQGWYGRQAKVLIEEGIISKDGTINWELYD